MENVNFDFSEATIVICPRCKSERLKDYKKFKTTNKPDYIKKQYEEMLTCVSCGHTFNIYEGGSKPFNK
jgi:uncharacterized protein YbaR (Trm112 family)